jgi:hypothetical protein
MNDKILFVIDDDKERQQTYYKPFIDLINFDNQLVRLIHSTKETTILDLLAQAACLCIHESMINGIDKNGQSFDFGRLKQNLRSADIPRVYFSNSANQRTSLELPLHLSMRSDDFYMNLPAFINVFLDKNKIDLELLAFGKNYQREKVIQVKSKLLLYFEGYSRDEPLSMTIEDRTEFRLLLEQFSELTKTKAFADSTFLLLNTGKLSRNIFEQSLHSIIKFIR